MVLWSSKLFDERLEILDPPLHCLAANGVSLDLQFKNNEQRHVRTVCFHCNLVVFVYKLY